MFPSFYNKNDNNNGKDDKNFGGKSSSSPFEDMMIQQMMYEMENNPRDPHFEDVGQFMDTEELEDWWKDMTQRYPQVFKPDDVPFLQHTFGTKLMSYFDNDPNKPIRLRILGSRMIPDYESSMARIPEFQTKTPHYIVKNKGVHHTDLSMIAYLAAHEEEEEEECEEQGEGEPVWRVGWDNVDETDAEFDNLVKIVQQNLIEEEEEPDMAVNLNRKDISSWNLATDGSFVEAFWNSTFTPSELQVCRPNLAAAAFGNHKDNSFDFQIRKLLMEIVLAWTEEHAGGVILTNQRRTKFQVIEFYGPAKDNELRRPYVNIHYANSPIMQDAELFLRDEIIKTIECSDELANAMENHLIQNSVGQGLNDIGSGLLLFEGRLLPIKPSSAEEVKTGRGVTTNELSPPNQFVDIEADGTFGIEFELSCAIGTQQEGVGRSLQDHANVRVKIREAKFSRPGFRYMYLCAKEEVTGHEWILCHDGSIQTNQDWANSSTFELVSPILSGNDGLQECRRVLKTLTDTSAIQINKSMGMHVHIGVADGVELEDLKRICQFFLRYEDVMDSFLGRTDNKYCQSNKKGAANVNLISGCRTKEELFALMNPKGRYHKLNLDNLKTGKRPTIEFRQHSATSDATKAEAWIRFCMAFVHNSVSTTNHPSRKDEQDDKFEELFNDLIRDNALKEYYKMQRDEFVPTKTMTKNEIDPRCDN